MMSSMRPLVVIAALAVLAASCGEDPLAGVGDLANEVIHEGTTTTFLSTPSSAVDAGLDAVPTRRAEDLVWFNADLLPVSADIREVLTVVWDRGRGVTSGYVQSGPAEIALVLPDLVFPASVPIEVLQVSSQLVFDSSSGILDLRTSAAFGLWTTVPYSVGRSAGQVAVLSVGQDPDPDIAEDEITSEVVADGIALTWQHTGYTYELFCRDTLAEAACWEMATSGRPLRTIVSQ
jgi:hypothetical protein